MSYRQSINSAAPPPTYTSEPIEQSRPSRPRSRSSSHSPSRRSPSPLDNGSESVVSAQTLPYSSQLPEPSSQQPTPRLRHTLAPRSQFHHPPPQHRLTLTSQGYILTYPEPASISQQNREPSIAAPEPVAQRPKSQGLFRTSSPSAHTTLKAINYASIFRKNTPQRGLLSLFRPSLASFTGNITINPFLQIAREILPPLTANETESQRKNLRLEVENGGIDVDIHLIGEPPTYGDGAARPALVPLQTTLFLGLSGGIGALDSNTFPIIARIVSFSNFIAYVISSTERLRASPLRSRWNQLAHAYNTIGAQAHRHFGH